MKQFKLMFRTQQGRYGSNVSICSKDYDMFINDENTEDMPAHNLSYRYNENGYLLTKEGSNTISTKTLTLRCCIKNNAKENFIKFKNEVLLPARSLQDYSGFCYLVIADDDTHVRDVFYRVALSSDSIELQNLSRNEQEANFDLEFIADGRQFYIDYFYDVYMTGLLKNHVNGYIEEKIQNNNNDIFEKRCNTIDTSKFNIKSGDVIKRPDYVPDLLQINPYIIATGTGTITIKFYTSYNSWVTAGTIKINSGGSTYIDFENISNTDVEFDGDLSFTEVSAGGLKIEYDSTITSLKYYPQYYRV